MSLLLEYFFDTSHSPWSGKESVCTLLRPAGPEIPVLPGPIPDGAILAERTGNLLPDSPRKKVEERDNPQESHQRTDGQRAGTEVNGQRKSSENSLHLGAEEEVLTGASSTEREHADVRVCETFGGKP
jgi:hypothetical protein